MSDTDSTGEVVQFPHDTTDSEERNRRILAAAEHLAGGVPGSWTLWFKERAEQLGVEPEVFAGLIKAQIVDHEKKERKAQSEARLGEQRAHRLRQTERDHQRDDTVKIKTAADRKAEKAEKAAAEKEAARQQKEAERKAKEKRKSFNNLLKLPADQHADELNKLAKRIDEDTKALQQEFKDFVGIADGFSTASESDVEPWPEAINTAELLQDIDAKLGKHVVLQPHQRTAVTLWTVMAWVHNEIATHSPILAVTSPEPDSGKTELLSTVARLVPKPCLNVESTGSQRVPLRRCAEADVDYR
jgi:flagellar biosynthesis GTPase FlhF